MPVNLVSPGVLVREVDLTLGQVQTSSDKTGAIVAPFARGPVDEPVTIASEAELLEVFGEPSSTDRQYESWLTISSYLAYGGIMEVVRSDNDSLTNSYVGSALTDIKIKSIEDYNALGYDENVIPGYTFVSRSPGSWTNGMKVVIIDGRADQTFTGLSSVGLGATSYELSQGVVQRIKQGSCWCWHHRSIEGDLKGIVTGISTVAVRTQTKEVICRR